MATEEHVDALRQGWAVWNRWRNEHPYVRPDLTSATLCSADLSDCNLSNADLREATLTYAQLDRAWLWRANLSRAVLSSARLERTQLVNTDLSDAKLQRALLFGARVERSNLSRAILDDADLTMSHFVDVNLSHASINRCFVYGISAWNVELDGAAQSDLLITWPNHHQVSGEPRRFEAPVVVDNLEVAQFVYLLLHNDKIRGVIDTIGKKAVLILGRFTADRKPVLNTIRERLRKLGFVPIMFDFEKPHQRDFTETIKTLAGLRAYPSRLL